MEQGEDQSVSTRFHRGAVPVEYQLDYEQFLFNTLQHRLLQANEGWMEFHLLQPDKKKVLASIFFHVSDGVAKSPARAPFGGLQASKSIDHQLLFHFMGDVNDALHSEGANEIEIVAPAEMYSALQPFISISLINQGFQIVQAEPGACIVVDETPLREKMSKDKRSRLQQCIKAGLSFKSIELDKLSEVYNFISGCRAHQNRRLSMTLSELSKTVRALSNSFFLVGVFDGSKMISACVCVRVSSNIVYTFYSAHDAEYDAISPRIFLLANLYVWCREHQVTLLDLGTSAVNGKPNFPLLDFKLRAGATLTPKYKFLKALA